jgi:hypothetical protein
MADQQAQPGGSPGAHPQRGIVRDLQQVSDVRAGGGPAGAAGSFSSGGGRLLSAVRVHLIFWGTAWTALPHPTPSVGDCTDAVVTILASDYMRSLAQYGVGGGKLGSVTVVDDAVGGSPASPPNPFSDDDVWQLVEHLRAANRIPTADIGSGAQGLYLVVMPNGTTASNSGVIGEHSYYWFGSPATNVPFAWVTQSSLDMFSEVFSHELVEACTDPEGTGWTSATACGTNHGGWCEIGDVCEGNTATVQGVVVQRYWSNSDNSCVVPDDPKVVKDTKEHKESKENKDNKDHKDIKENKENKDGAKDKETRKEIKDGKEKEFDRPGDGGDVVGQLQSLVQQMSAVLAQLAGSAQGGTSDTGDPGAGGGQAQAFIGREERPPVAGG